jgi:hypothetical protein
MTKDDKNSMSLPPQLLAAAKARTTDVIAKVKGAMKQMELDIQNSEGIYPFNGGRITVAEVCRRAKISNMTLQAPSHRDSTKVVVEEWIRKLTVHLTTGAKIVRRAVTDRAEEWKRVHDEIATAYHIDHLTLVNVRADLDEAQRRIKELEELNATLLEQLKASSGLNITPISKGKK